MMGMNFFSAAINGGYNQLNNKLCLIFVKHGKTVRAISNTNCKPKCQRALMTIN